MKKASSFKPALIAPCGMNCGLCLGFLREKNRCGGCRMPDRKCNINCVISSCGKRAGKYCDCDIFPCRRLKQLDKRYRTKYSMSMLDNLESIRREGVRKFLKEQREKYSCKKCGGTVCVHRGYCLVCGWKKN